MITVARNYTMHKKETLGRIDFLMNKMKDNSDRNSINHALSIFIKDLYEKDKTKQSEEFLRLAVATKEGDKTAEVELIQKLQSILDSQDI